MRNIKIYSDPIFLIEKISGKYFTIILFCACLFLNQTMAQTYRLVDFNNTSDLTTLFNPDSSPEFTNLSNLGIGGTGSINVPIGSSDIWTTKAGYSVAGVGDVYTLSAYFKIKENSGYGGLGFAPIDTNEPNSFGSPVNGLGMCFHGGGGYFVNNRTNSAVSWPPDLVLGNWYKMILKVTATAANTYDLNFQIWNSNANGTLGTMKTEQNLNGIVNTSVGSASTLYVYFSAAGSRMEKIDNFEINLQGGAVIVEAGLPVVLTNDVTSITVNTAICGGNVTDDRGAGVTARGVCWNTSGSATTSDSKTTDGSGTGTFVSSITGLAGNTVYYVRSYATNSKGTSYGNEISFLTLTKILYVKHDASGSNNGTSWVNAYTSFQSALDAAASGDQIWVAKGTYNPSSAYDLTNTPRYYHFRMKGGVEIYGGFAGTETDISQRTNFEAGGTNETILSGDIGTTDDNTDNCYHVFYHPDGYGLTSSAVLNGFTIKCGYAEDNSGDSHLYRGGGMNNGSGNNPSIENCTFNNNTAGDGGGIYNKTCSPSISNCIFSNNTALNLGGGIYLTTSANTAIINCLVINNNAVATGGGIYLYATDIATDKCNPVITNTTIANNSANLCGGIRIRYSTPTLNNCIIWGNAHTDVGAGSQIYMSGTGSSTNLNYSCYSNGVNDIYGTPTASNCITTDPQFAGSGDYPFSIKGTSSCADAGNNSDNTTLYDIRGTGFSRKLNKTNGAAGTIDIGAYEYKFGEDIMPVELTSFDAHVIEGKVILNWKTATEVNNYGFNVERRTRSKEWKKVGFVEGNGNSNSLKEYSFIDGNIINEKYSYRLQQIDNDSKYEYSKIVEVNINNLPEKFELQQNYPNPFNPTTKIKYSIPNTEGTLQGVLPIVELKVYDVLGNEVATLVNEKKSAGKYEVEFNAANLSGGIYFCQLKSDSFNQSVKMILLK